VGLLVRMWGLTTALLLLGNASGRGSGLQHFLQTPKDSEVAEGGRAVLLCQVGDRVGSVQWTRDGLTLGYDRDLPGFDRYAVLGTDEAGTYNLEVSNATLVDAAKFECQVGPGRGNPPIRANARLTVTLPPTRVELIGESAGGRLEVPEHQQVSLACRATGARPPAKIQWFRNNVAFNLPEGDLEETEEEEGAGNALRTTTTSRIRFRPGSEDNQALFACEAHHQALQRPLRAPILLSILFPPQKPEITGYIQGETIRMGATVKMVCQAHGGNPLAQVIWFKNNQRIDHSYTTTGTRSENTFMFLAQPDDNNAVYRCEAKNRMVAEPLIAEIVMSVQFAPDSVTIHGPATARVGETVTLECTTSNSNPASSLQWVVDGRTVGGLHNRTDTSIEGGWRSMANMSLTVGAEDKTKTVSCYANNLALSETKVETHTITVLYPPGAPTITGYRTGELVREGDLRRLKCTALSGNPLPTLQWFAGGHIVEEGVTRETGASGTFVSAELALLVAREDHQKLYECRAGNEATEVAVGSSVRLAVAFPPKNLHIRVTPDHPKVGVEATLTCEAGPANPPPKLTWFVAGQQVVAAGEGVEESEEGGGSIAQAVLSLPVSEAHIAGVFKCEAKHAETSKSLFNVTKIDVQYKPRFREAAPRELRLEANSSRLLRLPATANPPISDFSWLRKGGGPVASLKGSLREEDSGLKRGVVADGDTLHLREVRESDAGTYVLRAENSLGSARRSVRVTVLHPPRLTPVAVIQLKREGETVSLGCQVTATPPGSVRWSRPGFNLDSRARVDSKSNGSVLTISNLTAADAGSFDCVATNGVPAENPVEVRQTLFLLVHQRPSVVSSPDRDQAASPPGSSATLLCRAKAAPNVTFSWERNGQQIEGGKFSVEKRQVDPLTWESSLEVRLVQTKDFGSYVCVATNQWGETRHQVLLGPPSRPNPPSRVQVVAATYNSVTLNWRPGFNGGFPQYFRVRLQRPATTSYLFVDVFPHNASEFTVSELQMDTGYTFAVMAFNKVGESGYSAEVQGITASSPPPGARHTLIQSVLEERGELPAIIIVTVAIAGVLLLCLNAILLYCFVNNRRAGAGMDTLSEGSASSSKSATIEMYVGSSSYNETLSGETLSSMSEKSDSYFTTELDSRHRPGGGPRYLADHSPVYGPADFQEEEPDDEHHPLPSSHAFPPSWGHCTLPRPQPGQNVPRARQHGLSRQHSTSNLGARQREGRATAGCHYYSPPSAGEAPTPSSSYSPPSGEPSGYSQTSRGRSASSRGRYSPPSEPHPVLPHIYSNQLPQAYPDLPPPPPLLSPPSPYSSNASPYYSPPTLERAPKFGDV